MRPQDFGGWFCATEGCEYSQERQNQLDECMYGFLNAQHPGMFHPPGDVRVVARQDKHDYDGVSTVNNEPELRHEPDQMDLDTTSTADGVSNPDKRATTFGEKHKNQAGQDAGKKTKRTPLPSSRPARPQPPGALGPNTYPPAVRATHSAEGTALDLSLFGPRTAERVTELLEIIAFKTQNNTDPKKWFPEEDQLLDMLRTTGLSHGQIADVSEFLRRHSRNACESRFSRMKRGV
ncbi:hypothetical protein N657DRAFT_391115 [Parathielavia appendiculata]|uniref:Myb-like domain-containing protein n=1 Tax=Parathielavia appendiculata TaxID=2587402 RepID=A0AAN6U0Z6_9PEZI|nr:hypothetical protein N657DRAFT_391115 [Parathielavia appendiculata]